ncbi:hypothetical protein PQQ51_15110 [Paraburkholderia xenovorans]|uniref:hypothetical protein n=1 Tax=Paraburkholderia xenovorans TaxID=36873 RepID=UPI0038BD1431
MAKLPTTNGVVQAFLVNQSNVGNATFAPDGLAPSPIFGLGGQQLQGNEIVQGGIATLVSYVGPLLNSGAFCWVLVSCEGGALQVAPAGQPDQAVQLQQIGHGQCSLSVASPTSIALTPLNGNNLIIGGVPQQIADAGVSASNSGLAASTFYYVYASFSEGAVALQLATTGYVFAKGIAVKSGDSSQTLVGAIATDASSNFVDSVEKRFCLSYFNRRTKNLLATVPTVTFTNETMEEVTTAARVEFISWADEAVQTSSTGEMSANQDSTSIVYQNAIDGTLLGDLTGTWFPGGNAGTPIVSTNAANVAEGSVHYATLLATVSVGTGAVLHGYTRGVIRG